MSWLYIIYTLQPNDSDAFDAARRIIGSHGYGGISGFARDPNDGTRWDFESTRRFDDATKQELRFGRTPGLNGYTEVELTTSARL